jgi:hypothetical protein
LWQESFGIECRARPTKMIGFKMRLFIFFPLPSLFFFSFFFFFFSVLFPFFYHRFTSTGHVPGTFTWVGVDSFLPNGDDTTGPRCEWQSGEEREMKNARD